MFDCELNEIIGTECIRNIFTVCVIGDFSSLTMCVGS